MIHEIELFFLGMAAGMSLSVVFDFFRAFRKSKTHTAWAVGLEDLFYWLLVSLTLFFLIQIFNQGVLRFSVFLGCGIGCMVYFLTITKLIFPVFFTIFKLIKQVLSKCCLFFGIIKKIIKKFIILPRVR